MKSIYQYICEAVPALQKHEVSRVVRWGFDLDKIANKIESDMDCKVRFVQTEDEPSVVCLDEEDNVLFEITDKKQCWAKPGIADILTELGYEGVETF